MVAPSAVNQESISAPSTPTRPIAEEKAAMTSSAPPDVPEDMDAVKDITSAEPAEAEAEKVAAEPEPEPEAGPPTISTSTVLVVEAECEKKCESPYNTIIDLLSVIHTEQRKHAPSWVPSCFDPCTSTAQEAAADELMKESEIMEKANAMVDIQAEVSPENKAEEASADVLETKPETAEPPKTNEPESEDDSTQATMPELTVETIGSQIEELFDTSKVNDVLDAFDANLYEDKKKCDKMVTVGGCHALVQLVKNCVAEAIENIPDHDQVTDLLQPELKTLFKALAVITNLTYHHEESQIGITVIGGVGDVVKVMETFPLNRELQRSVCAALCNLTCCPAGKKKASEAGGIPALIAAVTNHTDSALICQHACDTLENVIDGSIEQIKVFMTAGGVTALTKVRDVWPENKRIQASVLGLSKLIRQEMKSWINEE
jgi:hypothetical protein